MIEKVIAEPRELEALFRPRGVVVVGASPVPGKIGNLVVQSLQRNGFGGDLYPVNRAGQEVLGLRTYSSVLDVPDPVDLAVIAVPADAVSAAFDECAQRRVKAAIVLSSGFSESGDEGAELERRLRVQAATAGVRLLGPNCQGVVSLPDKLFASFSPSFQTGESGSVSMVSQSGGYNSVAFRLGLMSGVHFSRIVSTGNECDITATDLFEFLAEDPETEIVAAYLEQVRDARRFLDVVSELSAKKPVVVAKAGRTDVGGKAASSHTGSLAGSGAVAKGVLAQAGALAARSVDEMISLLVAFSGPHTMAAGDRVGLLSQGGGFGVETTDLCRERGMRLPAFRPETVAALGEMIPYYGTADNPVDFTAALMGNPAWLAETVNLLAKDDSIDMVALLLTSSPGPDAVEDLANAVRASSKPIVIGWLGGVGDPDRERLHGLGVPTFFSPLSLTTGLKGLAQRGQHLLGGDFAGTLRPPKGSN